MNGETDGLTDQQLATWWNKHMNLTDSPVHSVCANTFLLLGLEIVKSSS